MGRKESNQTNNVDRRSIAEKKQFASIEARNKLKNCVCFSKIECRLYPNQREHDLSRDEQCLNNARVPLFSNSTTVIADWLHSTRAQHTLKCVCILMSALCKSLVMF